MSSKSLGYWSSVAILVIGIGYVIALAVGFARHGFREPITDPVLAAMEILTLLSAFAVVFLAASIYGAAARDRKVVALVGVIFAALFAGTTSALHFMELTAGRQLGDAGIVWPSRRYAAELLAWDVFLGVALVAMSATYDGIGARRHIRRTATTCG